MSYIVLKYIITAGLIVLISELAKFSDKIGALTSALTFSHNQRVILVIF